MSSDTDEFVDILTDEDVQKGIHDNLALAGCKTPEVAPYVERTLAHRAKKVARTRR